MRWIGGHGGVWLAAGLWAVAAPLNVALIAATVAPPAGPRFPGVSASTRIGDAASARTVGNPTFGLRGRSTCSVATRHTGTTGVPVASASRAAPRCHGRFGHG